MTLSLRLRHHGFILSFLFRLVPRAYPVLYSHSHSFGEDVQLIPKLYPSAKWNPSSRALSRRPRLEQPAGSQSSPPAPAVAPPISLADLSQSLHRRNTLALALRTTASRTPPRPTRSPPPKSRTMSRSQRKTTTSASSARPS
jgi:hypothetical protein